MRVGVFTPQLAQLSLQSALKKIKTYNIDTVELGTGNYPGDAHCNLSMLDHAAAFSAFRKTLSDHGFTISALSCHGNPLHPDRDRARHDQEISRKTILLDTKPYTDERNRAWIFRTCGFGHGEAWWREFVSTLRMFGYDSVLSIEHEDSLLAPEEGLAPAAAFLNQIVPREPAASAWWV